ncbi:hypothetical protein [Candidatus Pyrohabitans sp.]
MSKSSKPNVFIIESLRFSDEKHNRFEGKFLSQILCLGGKETEYYYIRTKKELEEVLNLFDESNYRYLHISCHGTNSSLSTTLDELSFSKFGKLIRPHLTEKRLFISACSAVNDNLAREIFPNSKCYSLIGPREDILFHDAAIIWASFYHLIFKENPKAMSRRNILPILKKVTNTFEVSLNYFSINKSKKGYKRKKIEPKQQKI